MNLPLPECSKLYKEAFQNQQKKMVEKTKADELATKQREISVSEFFAKNRHLLGFDNPRKALLMAVKEAVDNSLDATQEANILPDIHVELQQIKEDRFKVIIEDNGPGIVKAQIPKIFGKLLYGSKFHRLRQSLTADEPIIIKRNGKIEIIPIGELVDSLVQQEEDKEISDLNIQVPAFDPKTNKYRYQTVSHAIKHPRENEILKIKTQYNKEIKVTGCHSLFTFNSDTKSVESTEARNLKEGDYLIVPRNLPDADTITEINILNYISKETVAKNWIYVYGIKPLVEELFKTSTIIHKKVNKSRRFYRIEYNGLSADILDDSMKQYLQKGFLPLTLIYHLHLIPAVKEGQLVTYYHGKINQIPITIPLNKSFIRFLGIYIAEGHPDTRQLGLTFGKHEQQFIDEVIRFAQTFGLGFSVEPRDRSIRLKLFNNPFTKFIHAICGRGAFNKKIPEFIFRLSKEDRWHFIDSYCQGDGHRFKKRNAMTFCTKSKVLATQLQYLFLMNGITSSYQSKMDQGLGKTATRTHTVSLHGDVMKESHVYSLYATRKKKQDIDYNMTRVIGTLQQEIQLGDLGFVKIKNIEIINEGYDYVYDLSVPGCENFVGGLGGISCHNSRGQQGIGISAVLLYGQLTTGKGMHITSKVGANHPAHYFEIHIDTQKNEPIIREDKVVEWKKDQGTRIEVELNGIYQKGKQSVDEFIKEVALINPQAQITYKTPEKETLTYARGINELPKEAKEIKPHPHGVELGVLIRMMQSTTSGTVSSFLQNDFCRISAPLAQEICDKGKVNPRARPITIARDEAELLYNAIQSNDKIIAPPTDCLSPLGEDALIKGLKKEVDAEFYAAITRKPSVYRGNPFQLECAIAYGGSLPKEEPIKIMRFANRVPLLYQQGACSTTESIVDTSWKNYGISQSKESIPVGPVVIVLHMASVWVPFTSEAKEAIAHYPEIIKEMKLAIQEAARQMASYIRKTVRAREQQEKVDLFVRYIPELALALSNLSGMKKEEIQEDLDKVLKKGMKDLLAEVKESEQTEIKGKNIAYGEKQQTLSDVGDAHDE